MFDAVSEVVNAIKDTSGVYIEDGMPESFLNGDGTSVFSTYTAVGWVDLAQNQTRAKASIGGAFRERTARVAVNVQFYTLGGEDGFDTADAFDAVLFPLGYRREMYYTQKEELDSGQSAHRSIMRYAKEARLTVPDGE